MCVLVQFARSGAGSIPSSGEARCGSASKLSAAGRCRAQGGGIYGGWGWRVCGILNLHAATVYRATERKGNQVLRLFWCQGAWLHMNRQMYSQPTLRLLEPHAVHSALCVLGDGQIVSAVWSPSVAGAGAWCSGVFISVSRYHLSTGSYSIVLCNLSNLTPV